MTWSVNSSSPPCGTPAAIRETRTGEDDLLDVLVADAALESIEWELIRSDAIERSQQTVQDVVATPEASEGFECDQVGDLGNHADDRLIAPPVLADGAPRLGTVVAAELAARDLVVNRAERTAQRVSVLLIALEYVKRQSRRRAPAHAGQASQQRDE